MRPIAIDTNAYVAFKRGDSAVLEVLRHAEEILLTKKAYDWPSTEPFFVPEEALRPARILR